MQFIYLISVVKELRLILSKYMIRRLKSEIAIEIPPSSQVVLYHGLSPMQKDLYKAILSKNYRNYLFYPPLF